MKQAITALIADVLQDALSLEDITALLEIPPSEELGDYAFPCFSLARLLRKNPTEIALDLAEQISSSAAVASADAVSGYLNIFVNKEQFYEQIVQAAREPGYGSRDESATIVVEYCSPNTNKPLHLGHLRNMALGESVARILAFHGNRVVRTCVYNDRGVHICKSMLAYKLFGNGAVPEAAGKKPDHLVGDYYVLFGQKAEHDASLEHQAQQMLREWEDGDADVIELWRMMNDWALGGFRETYELIGISFDKEYFESELYESGKQIVAQGLDDGVFELHGNGATVVDLDDCGLGEKVLLRSDGTAVYIVQDLYLAQLKKEDFGFDRSIYVVGNEQDYHFNVLKAIYRKIGSKIADEIHHLSYGMVELPEGKMKSREGTVVDADDLIAETVALAEAEIRGRHELSDAELTERSLRIALAAIKYQLLRIGTAKSMLFDPQEAVRFEGDTGPYLLYSYARANSILRKWTGDGDPTIPRTNLHEDRLLKKISMFPEVVAAAADRCSPPLLATYAFELSQTFNEFYHECPVLQADTRDFRILLVRTFRDLLRRCLDLLGIEQIEEM